MKPEGIWVRIIHVSGSSPREVGASFWVGSDTTQGSIGGGVLELRAMEISRQMMVSSKAIYKETLALGPGLGQCCGGAVTLEFSSRSAPSAPESPVWIFGAGHVGQALSKVLSELPGFAVTIVDDRPDMLEAASGTPFLAKDPVSALKHIPLKAMVFVMTYAHDLDFALISGCIARDDLWIGLIGSKTKWARFKSRLEKNGAAKEKINRVCCPIGEPSLGKSPMAISIGIARAIVLDHSIFNLEGYRFA